MSSTRHGNRDTRRYSTRVRVVALIPLVLFAFASGGCDRTVTTGLQNSSVEVSVTTIGSSVPNTNYTAWVVSENNPGGRDAVRSIAPNGQSVLFSGLGNGFGLRFGLDDVPAHCEVRPRTHAIETQTRRMKLSFKVTCSQLIGALELTIAGLPGGSAADVTVSREASSALPALSIPVTTSQLIPLEPATYTVEAPPLSIGTDVYEATSPGWSSALNSVTMTLTGADTVGLELIYTLAGGGGGEPQTVFEDGFEDGTSWTATVAYATGGATHTVQTRTTGGAVSPGYRHMQHVFTGPGSIGVDHLYTGGSYTPSVHGPIQRIDYQVSRIQLDPPFAGAAIGDLFIVVQDGVLYWAPVGGVTSFSNQTWLGAAALLLTPGDFTPAGLDFSDTGGEMRFGFRRSNLTTGSAITTTHGVDNWLVQVVR